ncbi:outer membrane putative beta-barrel porin/alpha-amylase [Edaphobacter aggregans]|uniref:Outer membrane putative beta-barrel porin/alpha-amylase n=1 Tax=Edaphobacter aggregans TaxID=570835 RepID=A0A3R9PTS5_9BACT|nr:transporter [Edaphobacter aggregans]RSL17712.1 outer membrane putative beta-barrel porin/alpha-amylase [Edaphobacter aggregans]
MSVLARVLWTALGAGMFLSAACACAQDLEPRSYSASPVGTSFAGVGLGRSSGDISFDPTIPVTNVTATIYAPVLGLGRTFGILGRQALLTAALPYAWGNLSGDVGNDETSIYRSGLADVKARFSINLRGSPAMTPAEFAKRTHRSFIIGTSLFITAPAGQYSGQKLINLGTNRWSFKPELGVSYPVKKLDLDLYGGAWFFMDNGNFYPGLMNRSQAPLTTLQGHVSYTVRRGLWLAVDSTWYGGGETTVNGGPPTERQSNSRLGATVSLPLGKSQSLKIAYSSGVSGTIGSKFNTVSVGWQHIWLDRRSK